MNFEPMCDGALVTCSEHWRDRFDWRTQETLLNRFQQFKVSVSRIDLHYCGSTLWLNKRRLPLIGIAEAQKVATALGRTASPRKWRQRSSSWPNPKRAISPAPRKMSMAASAPRCRTLSS